MSIENCSESQQMDPTDIDLNDINFEDKTFFSDPLDYLKLLRELHDELPNPLEDQKLQNEVPGLGESAEIKQQQLHNENLELEEIIEEIKQHWFQYEDIDPRVAEEIKQEQHEPVISQEPVQPIKIYISIPQNFDSNQQQTLDQLNLNNDKLQQQQQPQSSSDIQYQIIQQTYPETLSEVQQQFVVNQYQPFEQSVNAANMIPQQAMNVVPQQPSFNQLPVSVFYQQPPNMNLPQPLIIVQAPNNVIQPSILHQGQPINVFIQQLPGPSTQWNSIAVNQPQQMDTPVTVAVNQQPSDSAAGTSKPIRVNSENPTENASLQDVREFFKNFNPDAVVDEKVVPPKHKKQRVRKVKTPATCAICLKTFTACGYLKQHINSKHAGERFHFCYFCDKKFSRKAARDKHQAQHGFKNPHLCKLCPKDFRFSIDLNRHVIMEHTKDFRHWCEYCGKGFLRPILVRNHAPKCRLKTLKNQEMQVVQAEMGAVH